MDFLFELIAELFLEGSMEISSNKKISKWIRYPILLLLILFFGIIILGLILVGIFLMKESILAGFFIVFVGIFLLVANIIKFKKEYLPKIKREENSRK